MQLIVIFDVSLLFSGSQLIERGLGNIYVAALNKLWHLAVEKRQQQRPDMRSVNIRICHDNDPVITQATDIEVVCAYPCPERGNERSHFVRRQHLIESCFFYIEDLTFERQDRLKSSVPSLLC